jgi:hypothetical protein
MVAILFAGGLLAFRYREALVSRLTADGRRERILRRLNAENILVERNCARGEASVNGDRWWTIEPRDRDRAVIALTSWCYEQSGVNTLTVRDYDTGRVLVRWNGAEIERTVP